MEVSAVLYDSTGLGKDFILSVLRGATTTEKLSGTKVWVPTRGPEAGLGVSASLPLWGPGYYPRKTFENADAKSCTLMASALITTKKFGWGGDEYIVGPQPKRWGDQSPPVGAPGCCTYLCISSSSRDVKD